MLLYRTLEVWKVLADVGSWKLLTEQVDLVEEQDDRCVLKPSLVHNVLEQ